MQRVSTSASARNSASAASMSVADSARRHCRWTWSARSGRDLRYSRYACNAPRATVARRLKDAEQPGSLKLLDGFVRQAAQLLGLPRTLAQARHELGGALHEVRKGWRAHDSGHNY